MARQARSEATRRKIIAAAIDLFSEIGYSATGLGDIIDQAEMTKGALYYHFASKEALATVIVDEAGAALLAEFRAITESSSPALENLIHGQFVVADYIASNKNARIGIQLLRTFTGFSEAVGRIYAGWLDELAEQVNQAGAEGDLRADLDTKSAAEVILGAILGAETLSSALSTETDLRQRVGRTWEVLLPTITSPESLGYFREFVARESLRRPSADG